jgi:threonine/homoserine/homoserine lactone efflux protein
MIGLAFLMSTFWWVYAALRVAGGLFLVYLAWQLWKHSSEPLPPPMPEARSHSDFFGHFRAALMVQLSNPKALAYCASVLVTLLPPVQPLWMKISVPLIGTLVEGSWWIFIAVAFSTAPFRRRYGSLKSYLDRAMGTALALLGAKMLLER